MHCNLFLGAICILLEDIGFRKKEKLTPRDLGDPMCYYYWSNVDLSKIFADINAEYAIEMFLNAENLDVDRWKRMPNGIFMVLDGIDVNIHDPNSLTSITEFLEGAIYNAK